MSTEYGACIAYGYRVNYQECARLLDEHEELAEYLITIDCYAEDPDYIFGISIIGVDGGTAAKVNVFDFTTVMNPHTIETLDRIAELMGVDFSPNIYLVAQID